MGLGLEDAYRRAVDLEKQGRLDAAADQCRRILGIEPVHAHAHHLLALIALRCQNLAEATLHLTSALAIAPRTPPFLRTLAELCRRQHRHDRALVLAREAVALAPSDAASHTIEGVILHDLHRLDEARECQRRALALSPDYAEAHLELGECLLLEGCLAEGWEDFEARFRIAGARRLAPPLQARPWGGETFAGSLLLIGDQGFGDVMQFARYIPWARERCGRLALACSPALAALMADSFAGLTLFTTREHPGFEAFCPLSSLPRVHRTTLETIPLPIPYLRPEPLLAAAWRDRLAGVTPPGARRIGIAWAGRPTHANDANRSAPPELFAPLADRDILLISLQPDATVPTPTALGGKRFLDLGGMLHDFRTTAAVIANLDLVIAVDTAIVHLAGGMGRPVWIALPYAPDWRWLLDRADSPWYPTARLFRQPAPGDWTAVAAEIAAALP